jgi:parallel beta-helix repeat protein
MKTSKAFAQLATVLSVLMVCAGTVQAEELLYVDDDGADCAEAAFAKIQDAVNAASSGALILVCPGTYLETVRIIGAAKNGITLMANGDRSAVTILGDHVSWREGVLLQDVSGVRVSGFTFRDHGIPRVPTRDGLGEGIRLVRAHYCVLDHNFLTNSNMMGITLAAGSSNNLVEHNVAVDNDPMMGGCGFHLGVGVRDNVLRHNKASGNPSAGIMLFGTGPGNVIEHNNVNFGGRSGIFIGRSSRVVVRNNQASKMSGPPTEPTDVPPSIFTTDLGVGIFVVESTELDISGNHAQNNVHLDVEWDGNGQITWSKNHCKTASHAGLCD